MNIYIYMKQFQDKYIYLWKTELMQNDNFPLLRMENRNFHLLVANRNRGFLWLVNDN
jgi:hypothetical protein